MTRPRRRRRASIGRNVEQVRCRSAVRTTTSIRDRPLILGQQRLRRLARPATPAAPWPAARDAARAARSGARSGVASSRAELRPPVHSARRRGPAAHRRPRPSSLPGPQRSARIRSRSARHSSGHLLPERYRRALTLSVTVGRLVVIEGLDGAGKNTLTAPAARCALHARRPRHDRRLSPLRRRRARRAGPRRPARTAGRRRRLRARDGGAVRAGPARGRRRPPRRRWPVTTSCSSTATSPPTPPTARPGCTRGPAASSWRGCTRWRSSGSASPSPTGTCSWTCPASSPPSAPRTGSGPSPGGPATATSPTTGLQDRTADVYRGLAAAGWLAPWTVLDGAAGLDRTDPERAGLAHDLAGVSRPADPR